MSTVFFTADLHIGSKNIIGYCNRPYNSVEDMDTALINNWNSVVTNKDIVWMLGDMIWGHQNYYNVLSRLNGQKFLILGNHDTEQVYKKMQTLGLIQGMYKGKSIKVDGQLIYLSHYPHRSWNNSFHGAYHLYGHCHNSIPDFGLSTDVGVDKWNYRPVSFEELKEYFKDRSSVYNISIRDNYKIQDTSFHKKFTDKYKDRVNTEAKILYKMLQEVEYYD